MSAAVLREPRDWVRDASLYPAEIDCVTAVMLKILDGKCRMAELEKPIMVALYDALKGRHGLRLGADFHDIVARARTEPSEALREAVYEQRVLAETMISRPVMKAFKARLRQEAVLPGRDGQEGED
ncbi:hypothetical protein [Pseudothauera rhizosphaerae]|uniref:Uncharacterized protein n=1 Tax=Pseudothauera rhizosphaerae TaxID=2565932 RepID=A0A4S4AI85_9RHOO|nr:hypothetical protein [Pseudothauera rhizosphaerae]THF58661.1 hypothetical protein E6O51_16870 [Pseudothauera rhizosphaerae]